MRSGVFGSKRILFFCFVRPSRFLFSLPAECRPRIKTPRETGAAGATLLKLLFGPPSFHFFSDIKAKIRLGLVPTFTPKQFPGNGAPRADKTFQGYATRNKHHVVQVSLLRPVLACRQLLLGWRPGTAAADPHFVGASLFCSSSPLLGPFSVRNIRSLGQLWSWVLLGTLAV